MNLDRSSGHVRQLLRSREGIVDHGLNIETSPGLNGRTVTTVRRSWGAASWTDQYAARLVGVLSELSGAEVGVATAVCFIVIWDGVS